MSDSQTGQPAAYIDGQAVYDCTGCGCRTTRNADGDCVVCKARERAERTRLELEARNEARRARLGSAPYATSCQFAEYALATAIERLTDAVRYAPDEQRASRVADALRHVWAAKNGLVK